MDDYALTDLDQTVDAILAQSPSAGAHQPSPAVGFRTGNQQQQQQGGGGSFLNNAAALMSAVQKRVRSSSGATTPTNRRTPPQTPPPPQQQHQRNEYDTDIEAEEDLLMMEEQHNLSQQQNNRQLHHQQHLEDDVDGYHQQHQSPSNNNMANIDDTDLVLRRMAMWQARKNHTVEVKRREQAEKELGQCSFHPERPTENAPPSAYAPSPLYKDNRAWGYDEFINRYASARAQRDEKQKYNEQVFKPKGANWANQVTIPQPFNLGRGVHKQSVPSLQTSNHKIAERLREHHYATPSTIEPPSLPPGLFSSPNPQSILEHSPTRWRHI